MTVINAADPPETRVDSFLRRREAGLLWTLCALALLRVFAFSAAFPFFNNVDERAQFDTVIKYARDGLPRTDAILYDDETAELAVLYDSPEYFKKPTDFASGRIPPPLWTLDRAFIQACLDRSTGLVTREQNHEAYSPPVYYALAGAWYDLGKALGLHNASRVYWVRFLNVPVYALLFWLTVRVCSTLYGGDRSARFGLLLLLAFFPQDAFYSIGSDVLSPLFCLAALYLLIRIQDDDKSPGFHLLAGLSVAALFLVKFSNAPMLILFAIFFCVRAGNLLRAGRLRPQWPHLTLLALGCLLPVCLWLGWSAYALGDITGSAEKTRFLGWTVKPLSEIPHHPMFSMKGLAYFLGTLLETFWRGEIIWQTRRIAPKAADVFYIVSSCLFIGTSIVCSFRPGAGSPGRRIRLISFAILLFYILSLAALSMIYDFGNCWYPSREYPFIVSGRLILGALVPFLILYLDGLRVWLTRAGGRTVLLLAILLIGLGITISEICATVPVFQSPYNWFHLP